MQSLIVQSTVKICECDFLKVAALKRRAAVFLEFPLQSLPEANYQGNKIFTGVARSVVKFVSETLSNWLFQIAPRKKQKSSSFRRGAKCKITERIAGESCRMSEC